MMLSASESEQLEHGVLGMCDDFSSYLIDFHADRFLNFCSSYSEDNLYTSLLDDERSSSSSCPSTSSENCDLEFMTSHDIFSMERLQPQSCESPRKFLSKEYLSSTKNVNSKYTEKKSNKFLKQFQKKWCEYTKQQQYKALESLMDIVSRRLGLKEQLEVINIINPKAELHQSDTEFFIDFDLIDDHKYEKVKIFVNKEIHKLRSKVTKSCNFNRKKNISNNSEKVAKLKSCLPRSTKKLTRYSKNVRQDRKEQQSGFFVNEQVVAVAALPNCDDDSEEEIDILS
ncbi:protein FAM199X isoform X2 [Hydra vulgaris]|uniref:Protein FAM199X isoform X2 n=1 Tax=Hydra vulgaris TaxID=6087 RepID=A0ABM4BYB5_HYDVU